MNSTRTIENMGRIQIIHCHLASEPLISQIKKLGPQYLFIDIFSKDIFSEDFSLEDIFRMDISKRTFLYKDNYIRTNMQGRKWDDIFSGTFMTQFVKRIFKHMKWRYFKYFCTVHTEYSLLTKIYLRGLETYKHMLLI